MATDYLDHLAAIRLFSSCTKKDLQRIAKASDEITVTVGRELTVQGQLGHEAFVIVDGQADVTIDGSIVNTLGPGDHFGELALLDGMPRVATVTATTEMQVLVIDQRAFLALLDDVPGLARKVMVTLAAMVRDRPHEHDV